MTSRPRSRAPVSLGRAGATGRRAVRPAHGRPRLRSPAVAELRRRLRAAPRSPPPRCAAAEASGRTAGAAQLQHDPRAPARRLAARPGRSSAPSGPMSAPRNGGPPAWRTSCGPDPGQFSSASAAAGRGERDRLSEIAVAALRRAALAGSRGREPPGSPRRGRPVHRRRGAPPCCSRGWRPSSTTPGPARPPRPCARACPRSPMPGHRGPAVLGRPARRARRRSRPGPAARPHRRTAAALSPSSRAGRRAPLPPRGRARHMAGEGRRGPRAQDDRRIGQGRAAAVADPQVGRLVPMPDQIADPSVAPSTDLSADPRRLRAVLRAVLCRPALRPLRRLRDGQAGRQTVCEPPARPPAAASRRPAAEGLHRLHGLRLLRRRPEGLPGHLRRAGLARRTAGARAPGCSTRSPSTAAARNALVPDRALGQPAARPVHPELREALERTEQLTGTNPRGAGRAGRGRAPAGRSAYSCGASELVRAAAGGGGKGKGPERGPPGRRPIGARLGDATCRDEPARRLSPSPPATSPGRTCAARI